MYIDAYRRKLGVILAANPERRHMTKVVHARDAMVQMEFGNVALLLPFKEKILTHADLGSTRIFIGNNYSYSLPFDRQTISEHADMVLFYTTGHGEKGELETRVRLCDGYAGSLELGTYARKAQVPKLVVSDICFSYEYVRSMLSDPRDVGISATDRSDYSWSIYPFSLYFFHYLNKYRDTVTAYKKSVKASWFSDFKGQEPQMMVLRNGEVVSHHETGIGLPDPRVTYRFHHPEEYMQRLMPNMVDLLML